jgi:hypothetical protein
MISETPYDLKVNLTRALAACKHTQWALLEVGAIAAPEGATEIHNWQCLHANLQTAMRLLLGFCIGAEERMNVSCPATEGTPQS